MKNFDWTQFTRKIAIKAPMDVLYDAWTVPAQIERWFLSDATFYNASEDKIDKNEHITSDSRYEWQWFLWDLTETGIVKEVNGKDHVQFTFAGDCIVDVYLEKFKDNTIVSISQRDIPTSDDKKVNVRLGCDSGWSFYLVNLKSIYEGGIDLRNKNPELKPMLNN